MKVRTGFVSNSSSSSFIVISKDNKKTENPRYINYLEDLEEGKTDFGWEIEDSHDFISKLNFSVAIATLSDSILYEDRMKMIERVLIDYNYDIDFGDLDDLYLKVRENQLVYIDHQSVDNENEEMFESDRKLKDFLLNKTSYIHTDNDNH